MKEEVLFKKTPFGGFEREAVINYIQQLKRNLLEDKNIISDKEKAIRSLSEENYALLKRAENAEKTAEKLRAEQSELSEQARSLKERCGELESVNADKKAAVETIESCDKLVASAQTAAAKLKKDARNQIKNAAERIEKVKDDPEKAEKILQNLIRELS